MTDQIKHECGIAVIRLLKPLEYYYEKYGTWQYGLDKLYLLMEKQHNRGQEGAGLGAVKLEASPGNEFIFREEHLALVQSQRYSLTFMLRFSPFLKSS